MGTPAYLAPVQAEGQSDEIGPQFDVYSLGAVLYELLTGRPPFRGVDALDTLAQVRERDVVRPQAVSPIIDRDLETICLKCLSKEPAGRYGSAEALADDLDRWQKGEPIAARPIGRVEQARKWMRRNPAIAALVSVAAILVAVIAIGGPILVWNAEVAAEGERIERGKAIVDRDSARASERLARKKQLAALMADARSQRSSRRMGQRFETLETVREAVALAKELEEPAETFDAIRNIAVGALALPDLRKSSRQFDGPTEPGWRRNSWSVNQSDQLIAESSYDGAVSIRRMSAGTAATVELARLPATGTEAYVTWTADGRHLIAWYMTRPAYRVQLWRMAGEKPELVLDEAAGCVQANLTPDGRAFITVNGTGVVRIYDALTGQPTASATVTAYSYNWFFRIPFHPDKTLAYLMASRWIIVFDWKAGREVERFAIPHGTAYSMAVHPSGDNLYVALASEVQAWDLKRKERIFTVGYTSGGGKLEVDPSGELLVLVGWSGTAKFIDPRTGRERFAHPAVGYPHVTGLDRMAILFPEEYGTGPTHVKELATGREYRTMIVGVGSSTAQEYHYASL